MEVIGHRPAPLLGAWVNYDEQTTGIRRCADRGAARVLTVQVASARETDPKTGA